MKKALLAVILICLTLMFCNKDKGKGAGKEMTLTLGAYTVPKEAYEKEIIPAFKKFWMEKTGQNVKFAESYIASGAQARAIVAGFEADIAALSLEKDVNELKINGLITHNWKDAKFGGFITHSVVAIAFRPGNPKNIEDWQDLTKKGVEVLYPNPKTSGGAMWDINAIYGAGLKTSEAEKGLPDKEAAKKLLKSIQRNVKVMDKSGRASVTTFENGIGDVLVTYENEVLLRIKQGRDIGYVIPRATILIENPIAVIDKNVDKHGNRELAQAFVDFAVSREAQRAFAKYGFRPVDEEVAAEFAQQYPVPDLLFDIEYLGGWERVYEEIFGAKGIWSAILEELAHE
ncbi:MAG: sulfate ABC transporter substrate-binding protein [Candidatus Aminicenantes bacterium]|nr:sulfate ABC transporter substrate-binding protein [Candidatus Aminicenantes bacterium]